MLTHQLADEWRQCGIAPGDTVLIHSRLAPTLRRYRKHPETISPRIVLDSFLAAVGPHGTLLFPLFNFDFTKGVPFDIRTTPSQMGVRPSTGP